MNEIIDKSCFVLLTGASKGLGRAIAIALAENLGPQSVLVLTARSLPGLQETKALAQAKRKTSGKGDIDVRCVQADMSESKDVTDLIDNCVPSGESQRFQTAILIQNSGTINDTTKDVVDLTDFQESREYFNLNLTSVIPITARFVKWRKEGKDTGNTIVINISSLFAIQPAAGFNLYCSAKAARDMLFKVLAVESPDIRVLNYAPGPLWTDMNKKFMKNENKHKSAETYKKIQSDGMIVSCEVSASKLMDIIRKNEYKSGDHIDFFD